MKFRCYGISRASGQQMPPMEVEAADADSAIAEAKSHGMLVDKCEAVPSITHFAQSKQEIEASQGDYPALQQLSGLYDVVATLMILFIPIGLIGGWWLGYDGAPALGVIIAIVGVLIGGVGYVILSGAAQFFRLMIDIATYLKEIRDTSVGGSEPEERA